MIRQTSLNEAAKLDFANGIRSMMRQDPDVILVGEIRDEETAEMAFRAAMTGHQVFSTLHTNSALGAMPRLIDIGVKPQIMAGNIIGIVAQRLVADCASTASRPTRPTKRSASCCKQVVEADLLYRKAAASRAVPGVQGPVAVHRGPEDQPELDEMIARTATHRKCARPPIGPDFAISHRMRSACAGGVTSLAEISRVVDLTARVE